jgi:hypothetical protein
MSALSFVLLNWRVMLLGGAGAGLMWLFVFGLWLPLVRDPSIAREARREYVRISEMEAVQARARVVEQLLIAEKVRTEMLEAERAEYLKAVNSTIAEISSASAENEKALQDEIDKLSRARPGGIPLVRDLGVRLRN